MAIKNNPISIKESSKFLDGPALNGSVCGTIFCKCIPSLHEMGLGDDTMLEKRPLGKDDALRQEIRILRARFAKMSEVSQRITQGWNLNTVLREVVDGARSLTDARYGAVGVFDDSVRIREFITSGIEPAQRRLLGEPARGFGVLGYLNEVQGPLRLADLTQHSHSVGFPENHPPMTTFLGAPIRHQNEPVGTIFLTEKQGGCEFSEEDEENLVMFASQAAIAIVNALRHKLEQQTRDLVETERRRLAALVDSSPVGVLVVDAKTRTFALVKKEAERILSVSPEPSSTLVRYGGLRPGCPRSAGDNGLSLTWLIGLYAIMFSVSEIVSSFAVRRIRSSR